MIHMTAVTSRAGLLSGLAALALAACDEPTGAGGRADINVQAGVTMFDETEILVGTDQTITVEVRNDGDGSLEVESIELTGADAEEFVILAGAEPVTLLQGERLDVVLGFQPSSEGDKTATLRIDSNDPDEARAQIAFQGRASRFQYRQVDRMGIPGLNTVFNHASGVAGFDKKAYNIATPAMDVATYTAQFVIVLGAVGNPDPQATAALLLPDELPVSLGAQQTAFANLTGRALADDAVDVALFVTVGIAALQSDNVDANDRPFLATFPYVAPPND